MGIQIPAVVDQYQKRVDAHLTEATELIAGFQQTADKYFNGDMQALILHYSNSDDVIFRTDAKNIQLMVQRVASLQAEAKALMQNAVLRASHVLFNTQGAIFTETIQQYSYMILIDPLALIWGVLSGMFMASFADSLLLLFSQLIRHRRRMIK